MPSPELNLTEAASLALPTISRGQLGAAVMLSTYLQEHSGEPVTVRLVEAIGGAGKTELLGGLKPTLAEAGVIVLPDELSPETYRQETGFSGPIVVTGRLYGIDEHQDAVIPVVGFSCQEILDVIRHNPKPNPKTDSWVSRYAIGSLRLAIDMQGRLNDADLDSADDRSIRVYLSRIAAEHLLDRIPASRLATGLDDLEIQIAGIFEGYVPDQAELNREITLISYALYELKNEGFLRLEKLLSALGSDPDKPPHGIIQLIQIAQEYLTHHQGKYVYEVPNEITEAANTLYRIISRMSGPENQLHLPVYSFGIIREILRNIESGNLDGNDGVYREPRIRLAARIPTDLQPVLRLVLESLINRGMRFNCRKTAVAVFPYDRNPYKRNPIWGAGGNAYFNTDNYPPEHQFFSPGFRRLESTLPDGKNVTTLFLLTGDHTKIPLIPSMAATLVTLSILEQFGCPYTATFVNRTYQYDPTKQTLSRINLPDKYS